MLTSFQEWLQSDREAVLTTLTNQFPGENPACTFNFTSSQGTKSLSGSLLVIFTDVLQGSSSNKSICSALYLQYHIQQVEDTTEV